MPKWHLIIKIFLIYFLIFGFFIFLIKINEPTRGIIFDTGLVLFFILITTHVKEYYKNLSDLEIYDKNHANRLDKLDEKLIKSEERMNKIFENLKKTLND